MIISEANNFPELAAFYQAEVIMPAVSLLQGVLERGRSQGEFKNFNTEQTAMAVIAPMLFLIMSKHSSALCHSGSKLMKPEDFIAQHAELIVRGLSVENA